MNHLTVGRHYFQRFRDVFAKPDTSSPALPCPVWVLTISEGEHRFLTTEKRLAALDIEVTAVLGVSKFETDFRERCFCEAEGDGLTDGAVAVAMSHLHAWGRLVREDVPAVILLEDDCMPQAGLEEMVTALAALPDDADFAVLHSWGQDEAHKEDIDNPYWWRTRFCSNTLMASYITQRGARQLLKSCLPYWQPIDQMVQAACRDPRLHAYQIRQPIFNGDYNMGSLLNDID